ncbi:MAG: ATP-grasp domain-containing protein, partial [Gammaproteobacteria bacterium]|nr:ATP-grasp domain-containing protein [Gammaproteobacteria bacterium]
MNLQQQYPEQPVPGTRSSRLLIIAPHGSYRTAPFIRAAQEHGLEVLIASQGEYSIVSEYARGLQIDFSDEDEALQRILQTAAEQPFCGIIGTDDASTVLASRAAAKLGLPHNPLEAVMIARRKDLARIRLQECGVPVPQFRLLDLNQSLVEQVRDVAFPAVVKPIALSASRGVIRVDSPEELMQAITRIQTILHSEGDIDPAIRDTLLVEQFIPGEEVAVEGMLYDGKLSILTLFDKPDALDGPFFEETYYVTPSRLPSDVQQAIHATVQAACRAYGLREGP